MRKLLHAAAICVFVVAPLASGNGLVMLFALWLTLSLMFLHDDAAKDATAWEVLITDEMVNRTFRLVYAVERGRS